MRRHSGGISMRFSQQIAVARSPSRDLETARDPREGHRRSKIIVHATLGSVSGPRLPSELAGFEGPGPTGGRYRARPVRLNTAIGSLFAVGSACFVLGSVPAYLNRVGETADGPAYFIGALFFTAAPFRQLVQAQSPAMTGA